MTEVVSDTSEGGCWSHARHWFLQVGLWAARQHHRPRGSQLNILLNEHRSLSEGYRVCIEKGTDYQIAPWMALTQA